ncbi:MAG: hypothetical protein GY820_04895 [Gammaproteobacteria bacterium]|nr:hypothetical protein [Gammaproteobacteria bacterium]
MPVNGKCRSGASLAAVYAGLAPVWRRFKAEMSEKNRRKPRYRRTDCI